MLYSVSSSTNRQTHGNEMANMTSRSVCTPSLKAQPSPRPRLLEPQLFEKMVPREKRSTDALSNQFTSNFCSDAKILSNF